jgi:hypothetical protein
MSVSPMGPVLKGWSPPFTPTGHSAYWRFDDHEQPGFPGCRPIHTGILVSYEGYADRLAALLPAPLEPSERTGTISLFFNRTTLLPTDVGDVAATVEPDETRFHEVIVMFPCRLGEKEYMFHYIMYTDSGWCVYCGPIAGLTTKLADIRLFVPEPAHPLWSLDTEGATIRSSVSRQGAELFNVIMTMGAEIEDPNVFAFAPEILGMRYFPDMSRAATQRALVHDLFLCDLQVHDHGRAHAGTAQVTVGSGFSTEEQWHFEARTPGETVPASYVHGFTHTNLGGRAVYDYLAE